MWSFSRTRERPLRSSSTLLSNAPEMMPIRLATMMRPPIVMISMKMRNAHPVSPPMVPGSSVRIRLPQSVSSGSVFSSSFGYCPKSVKSCTSAKTTSTSTMVAMPSSAISARVPFAIQLSNQ